MPNRAIPGTKLVPDKYHPALEVHIRTTAGSFPRWAVVDSGADMTSVPAAFLEGTPIDVESLPIVGEGSGAGGKFPIRLCKTDIYWEKWKVCDQFLVIGDMGDLPVVLLGRADFFMRFDVNFDWTHKPVPRFWIKKIK